MQESPVEGVTFRFIETNGIRMRVAEMGTEGPSLQRSNPLEGGG